MFYIIKNCVFVTPRRFCVYMSNTTNTTNTTNTNNTQQKYINPEEIQKAQIIARWGTIFGKFSAITLMICGIFVLIFVITVAMVTHLNYHQSVGLITNKEPHFNKPRYFVTFEHKNQQIRGEFQNGELLSFDDELEINERVNVYFKPDYPEYISFMGKKNYLLIQSVIGLMCLISGILIWWALTKSNGIWGYLTLLLPDWTWLLA